MTGRKSPAEVANINTRIEMKPTATRSRRVLLLLELQGAGFVLEAGTLEAFAAAEYSRGFSAGQRDATDG